MGLSLARSLGRHGNYVAHSRACFLISSRVTPRISAARPRDMRSASSTRRTRRDSRSSTKSCSERPAGSPDRRQSQANSLFSSASAGPLLDERPVRTQQAFRRPLKPPRTGMPDRRSAPPRARSRHPATSRRPPESALVHALEPWRGTARSPEAERVSQARRRARPSPSPAPPACSLGGRPSPARSSEAIREMPALPASCPCVKRL